MEIGIIGLGLIGGSMAKALKSKGHKIYGSDNDGSVLQKALLIGAIDEELTAENVKKIDYLIISVYPEGVLECLDKYVPMLKDGAIVSDLCGIKRLVVKKMAELKKQRPSLHFVALHPMAGKEFSGIRYSSSLLYEGASLLAISVDTPIEILAKVKSIMLEIGFKGMVITNAEQHDKIISYTSQLAHIVSSAYIQNKTANEVFGFTAGSFKDMTRVARLNAAMWTELLLDNRDFLSTELDDLIRNLSEFKQYLDDNDKAALFNKLNKGNEIKCEIESETKQKTKERFENGYNG
ncbi:MAG: prephenate dehydrogenase [Christensenellales bacterium]